MRLFVTSSIFALLVPLASSVEAEELVSVYREELYPASYDVTLIYTQQWSAAYLMEVSSDVHSIYVGSEGKLSAFHGVLELHCTNPELSQWVATGEVPNEDTVPGEAIHEIRRLYC